MEVTEIKVEIDVSVTKMIMDITDCTPDKLITRLKQVLKLFEEVKKGELKKVPGVFRDYIEAVELEQFDGNRFKIDIECDDEDNDHYSLSSVSSGFVKVDGKYYAEPTPLIAEWITSGKTYEEFIIE